MMPHDRCPTPAARHHAPPHARNTTTAVQSSVAWARRAAATTALAALGPSGAADAAAATISCVVTTTRVSAQQAGTVTRLVRQHGGDAVRHERQQLVAGTQQKRAHLRLRRDDGVWLALLQVSDAAGGHAAMVEVVGVAALHAPRFSWRARRNNLAARQQHAPQLRRLSQRVLSRQAHRAAAPQQQRCGVARPRQQQCGRRAGKHGCSHGHSAARVAALRRGGESERVLAVRERARQRPAQRLRITTGISSARLGERQQAPRCEHRSRLAAVAVEHRAEAAEAGAACVAHVAAGSALKRQQASMQPCKPRVPAAKQAGASRATPATHLPVLVLAVLQAARRGCACRHHVQAHHSVSATQRARRGRRHPGGARRQPLRRESERELMTSGCQCRRLKLCVRVSSMAVCL